MVVPTEYGLVLKKVDLPSVEELVHDARDDDR